MTTYIVVYVLAINIFAFLAFGYDKFCAKAGQRRIPEATLFFLSLIGGSPGAITGMYCFHHKTRKSYFVYGLPTILILQIIAVVSLSFFA